MATQVTVDEEALSKAVKTKPIRKICPFLPYTLAEAICRGEMCQIWDIGNGHCQIENLSKMRLILTVIDEGRQ